MEGRGTALVLNEVIDASMRKSSFLSNHANNFESQDISSYTNYQDTLSYVYQDPSLAICGALHATFSNVSIVSSMFIDSTAKIGRALFDHSSSIAADCC